MLKEEEIKKILEGIIPELKKIDTAERMKKKPEPVYYPTYPIVTDYAERISVHAEIGKFPEKLFAKRSPNQEEKEWQYVKENYKQVTLPVFVDYISTITSPFHDANWSIDYEKDEEKFNDFPLQKYVEKEIKGYNSLENFVRFIVTQRKAVDANGIIAIKPHTLFTVNDGEDSIIDPDRLNEPVPVYYHSKKIVSEVLDKYTMVMLDEKSLVDWYGKTEKKGYKFELYDDENIWIIEQVGKYIDYLFSISVYFNHEWKKVPVIKLMGVPQVTEQGIIWQSPFLYVTDILDLVTLNSSNLQMSINTCVYPYRIMYGDVCEWKDSDGNICNDGVMVRSSDNTESVCPSCNGAGVKSRLSPIGQLLLKPKTKFEDGDASFTQPPISYVSPEVTTLEFLEDKIAKDEEKARKILHLQTSNSVIKGTENLTATGMTLDSKAKLSFVKVPTDQTFYIWEFILDAIGFMRYGEDYKKAKVNYPTNYDFVTESDIIAQLKAAVDGGLPPFVIHSIIYRYLQTLYFNDQTTADIFTLIVRTDRLLTLSNEQVALKVARGTVHDWEEILHTSAINFVNELIDENPNFLKQDISVQKEQLIAKAKSIPCNTGTCSINEEPNGQEDVDAMVNDLTTTT